MDTVAFQKGEIIQMEGEGQSLRNQWENINKIWLLITVVPAIDPPDGVYLTCKMVHSLFLPESDHFSSSQRKKWYKMISSNVIFYTLNLKII